MIKLKIKKTILFFCCVFMTLLLFLALRPISADRGNCKTISGTVSKVTEGGVKDLVIILSGQDGIFYINRGLEKEFKLSEFTTRFTGKVVTISFADHWTPLDPLKKSKHLTELTFGQEVVFSEFD